MQSAIQQWRRPLQRFAATTGVFFTAATVLRLWLSYQLDPDWVLPIRGAIGDLLVAVFLAAALPLCRSWHRLFPPVLIIAWALLTIASGEHLYALDAPLRLEHYRFAADETFIRGSFVNFITWLPALAVLLAAAIVLYDSWRLPPPLPLAVLASLLATVAGGAAVWQYSLSAADWRATSPLPLAFIKRTAAGAVETAQATDTDIFFRDEVTTAALPAFATRPAKPNVLVVFVEGLPGVYLRQIRDYSGVKSAIQMPNFSAIAENAYLVPDYVVHSSGTIGGLYATLCGDYSFSKGIQTIKPFLMDTLPAAEQPRCLPAILQDNGYQTVFMQAANLDYMDKGNIMPAIGFTEVIGKQSGDGERGNFWGVDDKTLLQRSVEKIAALQAGDKPWFLSLLTVGTHHPFIAPADYRARYASVKEASVRYLDDTLDGFMQALADYGVPEDTLIIFTSDESHGVPGHPLGAGWGLFAALAPGLPPQLAKGIFGQIDVRASVLDYLSLPLPEQQIGRSIFRRYETSDPRAILFFDYMLSDGLLQRCRDGCQQYPLSDEKLFVPEYRTTFSDNRAQSDRYLAVFARASDFYGSDTRRPLLRVHNVEWSGARAVIAEDMILPAKSHLEVNLDIESLAPSAEQQPTPRISWYGGDDWYLDIGGTLQLPPLPPGSRLKLSYVFYNETLRDVRFSFSAFTRRGAMNGIKINQVEVLATPAAAPTPFTVNEFILEWDTTLPPPLAALFPNYQPRGDAPGGFINYSKGGDNRYTLVPHYPLGKTLVFSNPADWQSLFYLAGNWNYPGADSVQSDGTLPMLAFRLAEIEPEADYEVVFDFTPFIVPSMIEERKLSFLINGKRLKTHVFTEVDSQQGVFAVSGSALKAHAINTFAVEVPDPIIPTRYNLDDDYTRRGLSLLSFQLRKKH